MIFNDGPRRFWFGGALGDPAYPMAVIEKCLVKQTRSCPVADKLCDALFCATRNGVADPHIITPLPTFVMHNLVVLGVSRIGALRRWCLHVLLGICK